MKSVLQMVNEELLRAMEKHQSMTSAHEGYAVLLEEVDELWHEVKHGTDEKAIKECVQVAAMAMRMLHDVYDIPVMMEPVQ